MRLGEILVAAGVVDAEQVSAALRQQVVYGGRLGTNVIELGYADADQIARALSRQHQVPAALRRHLERHDPAVLSNVPAPMAAELYAFPVAFSLAGGARRLVVCMRDPGDRGALAALRAQVGIDTVPCVAPELLVYALLERFYGVARPRRMAHAQHGHTTPLPIDRSGPITLPSVEDESVDIDFDGDTEEPASAMATLQLVELDDESVVRDLSQYSHTSARTNTVSEIAHSIWAAAAADSGADIAAAATSAAEKAMELAASNPPPTDALEPVQTAIDLPPVATAAPEPEPASTTGPTIDLATALAAVASAEHRDAVSEAVLAYMRGAFGAGLVLLAKDGLALGVDGFGGHFDADSVQSIVVPLTVPSAFQACHDAASPFRGQPPEGGRSIQDRFFKLFPLTGSPVEIAIAPVVIRERVVCLYYAHGADGEAIDEPAAAALNQLADAASDAFVRLIRDAKRH